MSTVLTDEAVLGIDIEIPADPSGRLRKTASGDLRLARGRDNLLAALSRRQEASPGDLLHRPDYGVGAKQFVDTANTPAQRGLLAARARRNLLNDARIKEARVTVRQGLPGEATDAPTPYTVTVETEVEIRYDGTSATLSTPLEL